MPVRWKGLSEYKRNFKWKKQDQSPHCSPTRAQKCRWAGIRSDELGISREPKFISKRRVPYYSTQVSKSFEWDGINCLEKGISSEPEAHQPLELHLKDNKDDINEGKVKTPDAPRLPETIQLDLPGSRRGSSVDLEKYKKASPKIPAHENRTLGSTEKDSGEINNGLNSVLQRKAGMNISQPSNFPRSSEYQRQFVWKTSQRQSPVIAADQFIHSSSPSIPAFKSVIIPETEYERSFKTSPPVKELKQQICLEERGSPGSEFAEISLDEKIGRKRLQNELTKRRLHFGSFTSGLDMEEEDVISCRLKKKLEAFSKTPENQTKQCKSEAKQKEQKQKSHKPLCLHRNFKKISTEYRSNFMSPTQYIYKDGAWLRIRKNMPDQVKELREKAEAYRQRIRGTHFSKDHLNQILSDKNKLWDLSSNSSTEEAISSNVRALDLAGVSDRKLSPDPEFLQPGLPKELQQGDTGRLGMSNATTVPAKRRLVWGESGNDEQLEDKSQAIWEEGGEGEEDKQESEDVKELEVENKAINKDHEQKENVNSPDGNVQDSASVSSREIGRLPTPQLRALGGIQRTHHDLTTPATGGAVLVSPPKVKSLSSLQIRKDSSGKQAMSHKHISKEDLQRKSNRDGADVSPVCSPTAGMKTLDPLPLRKEQWTIPGPSDIKIPSVSLEQASVVPGYRRSTKKPTISYWSPSCRIKGSLKDPEFQHNGNVASPQRSWLHLPLQERNYHDEDEDDKLSQLSARSAASSSLASQVLERAHRRKENFWGKIIFCENEELRELKRAKRHRGRRWVKKTQKLRQPSFPDDI